MNSIPAPITTTACTPTAIRIQLDAPVLLACVGTIAATSGTDVGTSATASTVPSPLSPLSPLSGGVMLLTAVEISGGATTVSSLISGGSVAVAISNGVI